MITRPVRERPADQVRSMIDRGAAPHRLRRGGAHLAVDRRLQRHREGRGRHGQRPDRTNQVSVSLPSLRVDAFTVGIAAELQRARRTGLTFAPEAGTWRMRQVINKLITDDDLYGAVELRLLAGLAAHEALLPDRPAHRDRRGHAGHRRAGPALRRDRLAPTPRARRSPCRSAGSCPSPSRRSSGSARTRWSSSSARSTCCATTLRRSRGVQLKWHDPKATLVEGIMSRGDRRLGPGASRTCGAPAAPSRSGPSTSTTSSGSTPWPATGCRSTGTSTGTAPSTRCCPGTTSRPGSTRTSCGRTGATPSTQLGLEDCRWTPCYDCGACTGYGIEHVVASATPPAGGSQGTGQQLVGVGRGGAVPVQLGVRA